MMNTADRVEFTKEMRDYTILAPNMADIHFSLLINIFSQYGYKVELLKNDGRTVVDEGLKYVHNDTCYPALLVIGQLIDALNTGKYDPDKTAAVLQTTSICSEKRLKRRAIRRFPLFLLTFRDLRKTAASKSGFQWLLKCSRQLSTAI